MIWRLVGTRDWGDRKGLSNSGSSPARARQGKTMSLPSLLVVSSRARKVLTISPIILTVVYQVTNTNIIKDHFSSRRHQPLLELCFLEWGFWGKDCLLFVSWSSFGYHNHVIQKLLQMKIAHTYHCDQIQLWEFKPGGAGRDVGAAGKG